MRFHFRLGAEGFAGHQPPPESALLIGGKIGGAMMRERWSGLLVGGGQRDPGLDAVHAVPLGARFLEAFGMGDAAAGGHPIDLARNDGLFGPQAVAMHDLALEQIADGGEADMGMRAHIDFARDSCGQVHRTEMVEKDERPDVAPLRERQDAGDLEPAKVFAPRLDDEFDHGTLGWLFARS